MHVPLVAWLLVFVTAVHAQFGFFDQMFGGAGGGGGQHHSEPQNVPSDSSWYRGNVEKMHCDKYLCPDTLGAIPGPDVALLSSVFRSG